MESPGTILIVDDEPPVRRLLRRCFESEAYVVREAANGSEALAALAAGDIDLITLDLNLGGEDGLNVARRVRATATDVAIIMVSGKSDLIDKVVGLEIGADDYIAKPFELREVLARVRSVLRRTTSRSATDHDLAVGGETESGGGAKATGTPSAGELAGGGTRGSPLADAPGAARGMTADEVFRFAGCALDVPAREFLGTDGESHELTTAEFELLHLFLRSGRQALSRDRIMDALKGADWHPNDRTIDNLVARLRRKLDGAGAGRAIRTIRGIGYQFTASIARESGRGR